MGNKYMDEFDLPENGSWLRVTRPGVRNVGIQFQKQGQAHVHIGDVEPDEGDSYILVSNLLPEEPRTASFGQLPDDAGVWMRRSGSVTATSVTVLAY